MVFEILFIITPYDKCYSLQPRKKKKKKELLNISQYVSSSVLRWEIHAGQWPGNLSLSQVFANCHLCDLGQDAQGLWVVFTPVKWLGLFMYSILLQCASSILLFCEVMCLISLIKTEVLLCVPSSHKCGLSSQFYLKPLWSPDAWAIVLSLFIFEEVTSLRCWNWQNWPQTTRVHMREEQ